MFEVALLCQTEFLICDRFALLLLICIAYIVFLRYIIFALINVLVIAYSKDCHFFIYPLPLNTQFALMLFYRWTLNTDRH